jgi:hypothetical protein
MGVRILPGGEGQGLIWLKKIPLNGDPFARDGAPMCQLFARCGVVWSLTAIYLSLSTELLLAALALPQTSGLQTQPGTAS